MSVEPSQKKACIPDYQTGEQAIVLGAREGNIGGAIAERLCQAGWIAQEDDCFHGDIGRDSYQAPFTKDLEPYDACVITLGVTHMESFSEVGQEDLHNVLYGSLELPLECARRYVHARKNMPCPFDTNGDGDCGRKFCPYCSRNSPHTLGGQPRLGRIVFIGSYAHDHPFTHCTSYCVAKAGLDMAARSLAWELMPEGFDVHIIHPHHVEGTPMTEEVLEGMQRGVHKMTPEQAQEYQRKDLRMYRLLDSYDIAEMVLWLLTDKGARWLSGTGLKMYGGVR